MVPVPGGEEALEPEARERNGEQDAVAAAAGAAAAGAMAADSGDSDSSDDSDSDGEDIDVDADTAQRLMALEHELQSNPSYEKYIEVSYNSQTYTHATLPPNWASCLSPRRPHTPSPGALPSQLVHTPFLTRPAQTYFVSYPQYINLLRGARGLRTRLHDAYEAFSSRYPLSEELWLAWVNDALEGVEGAEQLPGLLQLLRRATRDYLSPAVWGLYLE